MGLKLVSQGDGKPLLGLKVVSQGGGKPLSGLKVVSQGGGKPLSETRRYQTNPGRVSATRKHPILQTSGGVRGKSHKTKNTQNPPWTLIMHQGEGVCTPRPFRYPEEARLPSPTPTGPLGGRPPRSPSAGGPPPWGPSAGGAAGFGYIVVTSTPPW